MKLAFAIVLVTACGGSSGEPLHGDIMLRYGNDTPKLVVGTAVADTNTAGHMLVQLGSDNVDCGTYLDVFFSFDYPSGSFVYFSVDSTQPGTSGSADVSFAKSADNSTTINITPGSVTIDALSPRITGTVSAMTTDDEAGTLMVSGTFDVKRCF
jgi:hypothetical protein